jgi:hypothetical protein
MKIRHPLTVLTLVAMALASGAALAGGMPSDEGPEVVPEELGFEELETDRGNNLSSVRFGDDIITAIIKSQMPEISQTFLPAAYVTAVVATETSVNTPTAASMKIPGPQVTPKLPLAFNHPDGVLPRDHR